MLPLNPESQLVEQRLVGQDPFETSASQDETLFVLPAFEALAVVRLEHARKDPFETSASQDETLFVLPQPGALGLMIEQLVEPVAHLDTRHQCPVECLVDLQPGRPYQQHIGLIVMLVLNVLRLL